MVAVLDFNEGDNDDSRGRVALLGLAPDDIATVIPLDCLVFAAFIMTVVTFLFFFDGDTIANVDNNEQFELKVDCCV